MNVEIETEPAQLLSWEYLFRMFGIASLQCILLYNERRKWLSRDIYNHRLNLAD
jgi:hypothetical protein